MVEAVKEVKKIKSLLVLSKKSVLQPVFYSLAKQETNRLRHWRYMQEKCVVNITIHQL